MISLKYSEAAVEVLDILKYTREEDVKKIPKKFIEFLEANKSKAYTPNLDHTKEIKDMKLMPETEAMLGLIYMKYWANEQEKINFKEKIRKNELVYQEQLKEKYSVDKMFKSKESYTKVELPIEVKQKSFFEKMFEKVKNIFRR